MVVVEVVKKNEKNEKKKANQSTLPYNRRTRKTEMPENSCKEIKRGVGGLHIDKTVGARVIVVTLVFMFG